MEPAQRRRLALGAVAAGILLIAAVVIGIAALTGRLAPAPSASPSTTPEPSTAPSDVYRPAIHITPKQHWMNDPQRPFWRDGRWHLYYLYNADYPEGNGTAWFHVTSEDLIHWRDEGVAIEKYTNGLGDIQSGSAVVDENGTAGHGDGAVIAIVTQQDAGVQRQSMFFSTDGGYTFTSDPANPVLDNPGVTDFRDPKVVWDGAQWVMALAEGDKIGFYTSPDLRAWTYRSGMVRNDLGLLECPDLFVMSVAGDPSRTTWVLGASADGSATGRTTGYAYWTGDWDGAAFTPAAAEPQWLDDGADFYAAVTWPSTDAPEQERYALGWVANWAYARELPALDWQGGTQSLVRKLTLDDGLRLRATPMLPEAASADYMGALTLQPQEWATVDAASEGARHLRLTLARDELDGGTVTVRIGDELADARVVIDAGAGTIGIDRSADAAAGRLPDIYAQPRTTLVAWDDSLTVDIVLDGISLEVFAGGTSLTSLVFVPRPQIALTADRPVVIEGVLLERYAGAAAR
ncbi:glycoside hydrolase family 32 protein [Microbacterium sp.]|uniref:glycoside hydrolase family 32 protein n=1 Tax=Microbacterium sp. TaxID=51671 RepID=UPI00289B0494|nr:glycoside hydrolase family 32 protein [Microbacterium sp.]